MYCKKCGKEYPNHKKTCADCGTILSSGSSPVVKKKKNRHVIILSVTAAVAIIAVFLIVGLLGMVPADIKGTWYETTGFGGTLEFKPGHVVIWTAFGSEKEGTYTYSGQTKQGSIVLGDLNELELGDFTFDDTNINMGDVVYTREYVEQIDLTDMMDNLKK